MSSFPSDEQFDCCIAANKRAADALNWKDLPTKVIYRVQPQGSIETKRGADTVLELVNRENEEVKVWAPSTVVDALYSGPNVKKIPYIRSLGVRGKRKVLETVFLQDNHPSKKKKKKSKEEQPEEKDSEFSMKLSKITKKISEEEKEGEEKKPQLERQSDVSSASKVNVTRNCDLCPKRFAHRQSLSKHKKKCTGTPTKPLMNTADPQLERPVGETSIDESGAKKTPSD